MKESAKSRGLRGSVGYVGPCAAWVKILRELRGLRGSKYFLRGSTFYMGHNFYMGCVGQIYFLRGSKKILTGFHDNILVARQIRIADMLNHFYFDVSSDVNISHIVFIYIMFVYKNYKKR